MATMPTRPLHSGRRPRLAAEATTHRRMTRNAATALPLAASGSTAARRAKPSQATTNPTANPPSLAPSVLVRNEAEDAAEGGAEQRDVLEVQPEQLPEPDDECREDGEKTA